MQKHQEISRTATEGKFKSGLADASKETTKLHTTTHLLNEALRKILGKEIKQRGSNITPERLRFDFSFDRKLTSEEIKKIENLVNEKIQESLEVVREEMSLKKLLNQELRENLEQNILKNFRLYNKKFFQKKFALVRMLKTQKN